MIRHNGQTKRRKYYGKYFDVPAIATHIATDKDGSVWAFTGYPKLSETVGWCGTACERGTAALIFMWFADNDRPCNWRKSVRRV